MQRSAKGNNTFNPNLPGLERANKLVAGTAAHLAFQNISKVPENTAIYGEGVMSLNKSQTGSDTFFTEYNLPCCLRRCKFPKKQVRWFFFEVGTGDTPKLSTF